MLGVIFGLGFAALIEGLFEPFMPWHMEYKKRKRREANAKLQKMWRETLNRSRRRGMK